MQRHRAVRRKVPAQRATDGPGTSAGAPAHHAGDTGAPASPAAPQTSSAGFDIGHVAVYPSAPDIGPEGAEPSPELADRIRSQHGGGAPLDPSTRGTMEAAFGHDFSAVRIFADGEADRLNRSISASAFTLGSDIFLSREASGNGAYGGDHLLAHELTHVVQQQVTDSAGPLTVAPAGDAQEREADSVAADVVEAIHTRPAEREIGTPGEDAAGAPGGRVGRLPCASAAIGRTVIQRDAPPPPTATQQPSTTGTSAAGYKGHIDVELWLHVVHSGPVLPGTMHDRTKSYVGDQHVITATVKEPLGVDIGPGNMDFKEPAEAGLHWAIVMVGTDAPLAECRKEMRWQGPDVAEWTITPMTPGHQQVTVSLTDAEWNNAENFDTEIAAGADPTVFKARCQSAHSRIDTLYSAGKSWFSDCFKSYKKAYDAFQAALNRQRNAEQLAANLLFAALGGAAGGLVGAAVSPLMAEVQEAGRVIRPALFSAPTRAAITDAAKDIAKFVARIPAQQTGGGGKATGAPPAATTDVSQVAVPQGEGAVPAVDPLSWFVAVDGAIEKERAAVGSQLDAANDEADQALVLNPATVFDWDPVAVLLEAATLDGRSLDNLGPVPQDIAYERSFWEVWLTNYAYHAAYMPGDVPGGAGYYVASGVGGKLHDELDRVAQKFGETADQWIERYGAPAKAAAEEKVKKENE